MLDTNQTNTMQAYLNNPTLKAQLIEQITAHRVADHLVRGTYNAERNGHFVGCAVGCSIETLNRLTGSSYEHSDHSCYEPGFGVPQVLARLQDSLFEWLPAGEHLNWPLAFWSAVPVGADLRMVWPQFAHWLLVDPTNGVIRFAKTERVKKSIEGVATLYARWNAGEKPAVSEWSAAYDAAYAADTYAAAAYADAAADTYARRKQAAKLLELIAAAPQAENSQTTNEQP